MKTFVFKMYVSTKQGQTFIIGVREILAENLDNARKKFNRLDLPMHTFNRVEISK